MNAIQTAITAAGSQRALAEHLGVHPSLVAQWATDRLRVAGRHCRAIEALTHGEVTVHDLRPDIFGTERAVRANSN